MFGEYVYGNAPATNANLIWIKDMDRLNCIVDYSSAFAEHGFEVVEYQDDLSFRIGYEQKVKYGNEKLAVLSFGKAYIPYDILTRSSVYPVSLKTLFPKLNSDVLHHKSKMDLDLLTMVIAKNFDNLTTPEQTESSLSKLFIARIICFNISRQNWSTYSKRQRRVRLIVTGIALQRKKHRLTDIPSNMG